VAAAAAAAAGAAAGTKMPEAMVLRVLTVKVLFDSLPNRALIGLVLCVQICLAFALGNGVLRTCGLTSSPPLQLAPSPHLIHPPPRLCLRGVPFLVSSCGTPSPSRREISRSI
jgi:hypothetical protein